MTGALSGGVAARAPGLAVATLEDYLSRLASSAPAPGGGSAAALTAAQGAALLAMVANLTIGRPRFKAHDAEVGAILAAADRIRAACTAAIDRDAAILGALIAAYRLPKGTEEERSARAATLQARLREATGVPLAVARDAAALLPLCRQLLPLGNPTAVSDIGAAVACAGAAFRSAELNVLINLGQLADRAYAEAARREIEQLGDGLTTAVDDVLREVRERL